MNINVSNKAQNLLQLLKNEYGDILFYISAGCCDGTSLLCHLSEDFVLGGSDMLLGYVYDVPLYTHKDQFDYYKDLNVLVDVRDCNGSEYSLEYGKNQSFYLSIQSI